MEISAKNDFTKSDFEKRPFREMLIFTRYLQKSIFLNLISSAEMLIFREIWANDFLKSDLKIPSYSSKFGYLRGYRQKVISKKLPSMLIFTRYG